MSLDKKSYGGEKMNKENKNMPSSWRKLDNAAKVFPATATKKNTKVFRFYCELKEPIIQENLQVAMEETLNSYPLFKSVLRKGVFWFYLERMEYTPIVKEEKKAPCSELYTVDKNKYLFRVNFYKNRINFEVFHVLTDGTGATEFLRELVKNYLYITHKELGLEKITFLENTTNSDHENDSFIKYYSKDIEKPKKKRTIAHQLGAMQESYETLQVHEGVVNTTNILSKAKEYGVSITVYLTAVFLCAINEEIPVRFKKHPIVLMIPVNLRNFFPSKSMLNFFGYIDPSYKFNVNNEGDIKEVIEVVDTFFKEELTKENMAKRMNEYTRLEKHPILRFAPLDLKNWGIYLGAAAATRDISAIFSNMSVVKMPKEYEPYINQFGVFTSTPKLELCMCSFKEHMVLNFTAYYNCTNIKRNFFKILELEGIPVEEIKEQFPPQALKKQKANFQQWLNFISICFIILSAMADVIFFKSYLWSGVSIGATISMWITLSIGYKKRSNLLKNALIQLCIISLGTLLWDRLWGGYQGWSTEIIFPIVSMTMLNFMLIMAKLQKLTPVNYIIYVVSNIVISLIPLPFLVFQLMGNPILNVISIGYSFIILSYLIIFKKKEFLVELNKNLHI